MRFLMEKGTDPVDLITLSMVARNGRIRIVNFFLEKFVYPVKSSELVIAAWRRHSRAMRNLIEKGIDPLPIFFVLQRRCCIKSGAGS